MQSIGFSNVYQIQNVFSGNKDPQSHRALRNLFNPAIHTYRFCHFIHISTGFLIQSSDIAFTDDILCAKTPVNLTTLTTKHL
jgi:hypothetical protein